jgi:hypothetical protein
LKDTQRDNFCAVATDVLPALDRRPEARAEAVEDLVHQVREGRVRVPEFQRGLKWGSQQVLDLFDSIYRGYPIGSLLLVKRRAPAAQIHLGPLVIGAPEMSDAWWVVDGQQRLTALAGSMARPEPIPGTPDDPFVVYFDPARREFKAPPRDDEVPTLWVPATLLLDATRLSEWVLKWPHRDDRELSRAVFEAGKRLREYRVPMYVLDSGEDEVLREIFFRVNNSGKRLEWSEVHDALFGHAGPAPASIGKLADALTDLGMGTLDHGELTSCLLAIRGLDVTRTLAEHKRRDPNSLRGAVAEALPVLRQTLSFLRTHAAVPHVRLLPRTFVVEVLARFFILHPEPTPRTLELLTRWVWRVFLGEEGYDERTLRRRGILDIGDDDEEASVQALLKLVSRVLPPTRWPETFDARAARSRLVLLALASLGPRSFDDGRPIDVAALVTERSADAFRPIVPVRIKSASGLRSPANRMLHSGSGSARAFLVARLRTVGFEPDLFQSHAISEEAARALGAGNEIEFVELRKRTLLGTLEDLGHRLAGTTRRDRDRPSISYLIRQAET